MAVGEFELIDAIVAELGVSGHSASVVVGPGDDAAVVSVPPGHQLVTSVDSLVADLHFPAGAHPYLIAQRALRVSISDLAAMGAAPLAAVIALVLPKSTQPGWVRELSQGFAAAAQQLSCPVTGGNLTAGQLAISVTVQGVVPAGAALLRSGARAGDEIWVSGVLGGAAFALTEPGLDQALPRAAGLTAAARSYYLPEPQLALGIGLRGIASSAIDISDGLAADLAHVARRSHLTAWLASSAIPVFAGASLEQALHGGDDYQLCFTAPASRAQQVRALAPDAVVIGEFAIQESADSKSPSSKSAGGGLLFLDGEPLAPLGFDHFVAT